MRGFGEPANQLRFDIRLNYETMTVAQYFAKKYKPLNYPHLLCVNATKGTGNKSHWLPMEVVKVSSKAVTSFQTTVEKLLS